MSRTVSLGCMLVAQIQHVQRRTFDPALLVVCVSPNGLTALPVAPARNLAMISSSSLPNSNIQLITESFKFYLLMSLKKCLLTYVSSAIILVRLPLYLSREILIIFKLSFLFYVSLSVLVSYYNNTSV